jgi:hypothetical protein
VPEPDVSTDAAVEALYAEFMARTLPKPLWTHHAHLVVAQCCLERLGYAAALAELRRRIPAYNEAVGTPNTDTSGYHETLTVLYLRGIAAVAPVGASLAERVARLLGSPLAGREWPLGFYSRERLFSVAARRGWVEPDLAPGPAAPT